MKRIILLLCLCSLIIPQAIAQSSITIIAPAVERTPEGLNGVFSYITVVTQKGSGHIYIDTWPLAEIDIQGSARLAVQVACEVVHKDWKAYDFFITVRSDSPIIGGPSAGGAMTVALIASLEGLQLKDNVVMSGTINPDETIGPVGGLLAKAQAASEVADVFLVPEGQTTILVEEQKVVQQGFFTYVTTTQKEVDLVKEGKDMGLEVKEVYDIRNAVYEFTGATIEPPSLSGQPIETDFMEPYARQELSTIQEEFEDMTARVDAYGGKYQSDLQSLLGTARDEITYAQEQFDSGQYYTSMSGTFVAGLYITYVENLLAFFDDTDPQDLAESVADYLNQVSEEIMRETPRGMTALQCIAAAQNRVFEAKDYLENAQESQSEIEFIEYISYAQRRGESAGFWLRISREYQQGAEIHEATVKNTASSMLNTAQLSLVYGSSILPQSSLLQEATQNYQRAETEYREGAYASSIFSSLESKVYGEVALITSGSEEEVIAQRVERARERASTSIEDSRTQGIEPVLAVSYYELADSQTNLVQQLIYLGHAEEIASIYKYIEPAVPPESSIIELPSSPEDEEESRFTFGFIPGLILGFVGCLVLVLLISRSKK
jgi:uncharacterized protein